MLTLITRSTITPWSKTFKDWDELNAWNRQTFPEGWTVGMTHRYKNENGKLICTHEIVDDERE